MKFKRAYIKEDFSRTTEQGYEVVEIATSRSGRKYAIIHRPKTNDYLIAAGYRTDRGDWDQGYYDYRTLEDARNRLDYAMERAGDTRYLKMEGMKDTLDKMIKEESLNEEAGEDTLARKAVELSNLLFTFLYRYYTKENDSVITPNDKKAILKAQSAFDDIAERADSDLRIIRNDSEASLKNNEKQTYVDEGVKRIDTRKMSIIRGDDDIGVDEFDVDEDENKLYTYYFPKFTAEDRQEARQRGLEIVRDTKEDSVVKGRFEDIKSFADEYLGYELVPDYLYEA